LLCGNAAVSFTVGEALLTSSDLEIGLLSAVVHRNEDFHIEETQSTEKSDHVHMQPRFLLRSSFTSTMAPLQLKLMG